MLSAPSCAPVAVARHHQPLLKSSPSFLGGLADKESFAGAGVTAAATVDGDDTDNGVNGTSEGTDDGRADTDDGRAGPGDVLDGTDDVRGGPGDSLDGNGDGHSGHDDVIDGIGGGCAGRGDVLDGTRAASYHTLSSSGGVSTYGNLGASDGCIRSVPPVTTKQTLPAAAPK